MYGGIIVALPVILWQVWRFIVPALERQGEEVRDPVRVVLGRAVQRRRCARLLHGRQALEFLIGWSGSDVNQIYSVSSYVSADRVDDLRVRPRIPAPGVPRRTAARRRRQPAATPQELADRSRGHRVIAAVITPSGDPITMAMLGMPMVILYFLAILIGWLVVDAARPRSDPRRPPGRVRRPVPFPIDRFQAEAFDALDRGDHVVVAVPTGSGKTVVAEYGIEIARDAPGGGRSTPRRSRRCRTRSTATSSRSTARTRRPAHRRQLDQRRRPDRGDDHRGAAQHDLRPVSGCSTTSDSSCSTRCTSSRIPIEGRSGRR
jgi:hypothetical protein